MAKKLTLVLIVACITTAVGTAQELDQFAAQDGCLELTASVHDTPVPIGSPVVIIVRVRNICDQEAELRFVLLADTPPGIWPYRIVDEEKKPVSFLPRIAPSRSVKRMLAPDEVHDEFLILWIDYNERHRPMFQPLFSAAGSYDFVLRLWLPDKKFVESNPIRVEVADRKSVYLEHDLPLELRGNAWSLLTQIHDDPSPGQILNATSYETIQLLYDFAEEHPDTPLACIARATIGRIRIHRLLDDDARNRIAEYRVRDIRKYSAFVAGLQSEDWSCSQRLNRERLYYQAIAAYVYGLRDDARVICEGIVAENIDDYIAENAGDLLETVAEEIARENERE